MWVRRPFSAFVRWWNHTDPAVEAGDRAGERKLPNRQVTKRPSPILVPQPSDRANGTSTSYCGYGLE